MPFYAEQVNWTYALFRHLWYIDPGPELDVYNVTNVTQEVEIYDRQIGPVL